MSAAVHSYSEDRVSDYRLPAAKLAEQTPPDYGYQVCVCPHCRVSVAITTTLS